MSDGTSFNTQQVKGAPGSRRSYVLDAFVDAMIAFAGEAEMDPEVVRTAPRETPVTRLDEIAAARRPVQRWHP